MVVYPISTVAVAVFWWMMAIARANQRQQRYRQHTTPAATPAPPVIRARRPARDNALLRSEGLRYAHVTQGLAELRRRHQRGLIGDVEFHKESAALMASLSGWEPPEVMDAVPSRRYRSDLPKPATAGPR